MARRLLYDNVQKKYDGRRLICGPYLYKKQYAYGQQTIQ